MPPKKKGKGKKGKGKGGDKDAAADGPVAKDEPTEKEQELRKELDRLTDKLKSLKNEVEDLRKENEWLQEEAQQTRLESHEYMSYMSKKTQKRQTTIISLSDRNQQEIKNITEQKEQLLKEFDQKKEALKLVMMEKEAELARTKNELADLEEYQILQKDQEAEIEHLENEVQTMRKKHSEAIQKLKSSFLREKRGFQKDSDSKIQEMAQQATQEARQCLEDHTNNIKNENKVLRRELLHLIRRTRALHEHREELEAQHNALLREIQYGRDLKKLHGTRQNRLCKSFGIDPDGKKESAQDTIDKDKLAVLFKN